MPNALGGLLVVLSFTTCQCGRPVNNDDPGSDFYFNPNLTSSGSKRYAIGQYFKGNWYKSYQYCRRHGMGLATVTSEEEFNLLIKTMKAAGIKTSLWTSGTDEGEEGMFFWMTTGQPVTYARWYAHEPNNKGGVEHCLTLSPALGNTGGGDDVFLYNDNDCSRNDFFPACEYFPNPIDFPQFAT